MCYHIAIMTPVDTLVGRFMVRIEDRNAYRPAGHISAFSIPSVPVITDQKPDLIQFYKWGLIPFWCKDEPTAQKVRIRTFNARSETVRTKPAFRLSIKKKRCLVPVDGFYEWREFNKKKYPYFIRLKDHSPFTLAGIWDSWIDRETAEVIDTFSILTVRANPLMEIIHNTKKRMPVILRKEDEKRYLDLEATPNEIDDMLIPFDESLMEAFTVSRLILKDKYEIEPSEPIPLDYPELKY